MQTHEVQLQSSSSSSVYGSCYYFLNNSYASPKKDAWIIIKAIWHSDEVFHLFDLVFSLVESLKFISTY